MTDKLGPFELGKVHNEDCLEAMKELLENSIALCLTDPPYGADKEFENAKKAVWFSQMMRKWWEREKKLEPDCDGEDKRDWAGTESIKHWCLRELNKGE